MPPNLSLGGQLFAADGSTLARAGVNFRVQVLDAAETCVLYSEDHLAEDLSQSLGHFNLILGTGTSKVNNVDGSSALSPAIFTNVGSTAVTGCASSPMTFAAGQNRQIHVLYDLGAGYVTMSPGVPVVSSAYALVADSLNGLNASGFVQVNGTSALSQANEEYAFSLTNWPRLKALLDGTSSQYLPSTPTVPLDVNGQRITDVHDPTAAQDAATKHYVDTNLGGSALDLTAVGPMTGTGSTLLWDATANKWVAGTASTSPTGAAGGDLTGTYPNPTIANNKITSAKLNSTGIAVNRLVITNATDGTTLGYGACTVAGQVYAWTASGWACATAVTSVAGKTGAVTLNAADISGLGTAALFDWGTAANLIVRLDGSARLPAVDGSQLSNVNAVQLQGRGIASTAPTTGQVLGWNGTAWTPVGAAGGSVTNISGGTGLLGGPITTAGTLSVDVGTTANQILQLNGTAQVPAVDGSLLTGVNAVKLQSRTVAATAPVGGQVIGWNASSVQWEPMSTAVGSVTSIATSNGILGGPITSSGTLSIDTGTSANKILQLNALAQVPAVDGSQLMNVNAVTLQTRAVASVAPATGQVLGWNASTTQWEPTTAATGSVSSIATGTGLLGGPITSVGTFSVNVGTAPNQVVQENANAQIAQSLGSVLLPSYSFAGNANTGLYSPGPNQLSLVSNGTAALSITAVGNVGINRPTPSFKAEISSDAVLNQFGSDSNNAQLVLSGGSNEGKRLALGVDTSASPMVGIIQSLAYTVGMQSLALNPNGGNVGVNTTLPAAAFDVAATGTTSAIIVPRDTTGNRPAGVNGMIRYNTSNNGLEGFVNGSWSAIAAGSSAGTVTNIASGTGLLGGPISTSGTLSVNVGTAPTQIVQENVNAQIAQSNGSLSAPSYSFVGSPNSGLFSPGVNQLALSSNGTTGLIQDQTSRVGIGTSALQMRFEVYDSTYGYPFSPAGKGRVSIGNMVHGSLGGNGLMIAEPLSGTGSTGFAIMKSGDFTNFAILQPGGGALQTMIMDPIGRVGFSQSGFIYPANAVDIKGTLAVGSYAGSNTASANGMIVSGSVGVGTPNAMAALDVFATGSSSAMIVPRDTTGNRPAGVNGMIRYNTTNNGLEGFVNGSWSAIAAGSSAGTVTNIASGTGLLGGPITASGTLSVDVGTAANKIVQENANAQITQSAGTAPLPSYTFAGNTNTGLYSPGTNQVALAINGTAALSIAASGDVSVIKRMNFAAGGSVTNSAYGNGIVIDTSNANTPASLLVRPNGSGGSASISVASNGYDGSGSQAVLSNDGSHIVFGAPYMSIPIDIQQNGANVLRIDGVGRIGIGAVAPQAALDVNVTGTTSALILPRDTTGNRPTGINGMIRYNTTANGLEGYVNGAWSTIAAGSAAGTVTNIAAGTGLLGGPITTSGTLNVDVGTAAGKIVQENATAQIAQATGSVSLPSYSFAGNTNTGVFSPGTNQVAIAANGTAALTISAGGDATLIGKLSVLGGTVSGTRGVAIGTGAVASGPDSVAFQSGTAYGQFSFAIGYNTHANTTQAFAGGVNSYAWGQNSFAYGNGPTASGAASVAFGEGTVAPAYVETVIGAYNGTTGAENASSPVGTDPVFVVGNGSYATHSNALTLLRNGSMSLGSMSPQAALDVVATGSSSAIIIPRDVAGNRPTGVNGMLRYNTTSNAFEGFQNGAWTNLAGSGSTSFPLLAPNGGTNAPSYSFSASPTTGIYSPGSNQMSLATNGTAAITIAANGYVGIGSTAPTALLDVNGGIKIQGLGVGNYAGALALPQGVMFGGAAFTGQNPSGSSLLQFNGYSTSTVIGIINDGTNNRLRIGNYDAATASPQAITLQNVAAGTSNVAGADFTFNGSQGTGTGSGGAWLFKTAPAGSSGTSQNAEVLAMAIAASGQIGVGTNAPQAALDITTVGTASAIIIPRDTTGNRPTGVNGMLRYNTSSNAFEGYQAGAWTNLIGGGSALSALQAAVGTNTIDNTNYAQVWNWSTTTTQTPLTLSANALTSGSLLSLTTSSASLGSTSGLLQVANTGSSTSGMLARFQANSTAASGMTILANGNVGIGSTAPNFPLVVSGNGQIQYLYSTNAYIGNVITSSFSSTAPAYSFNYTPGTGMGTPTAGSNILTLATSGVERLRIDAAGSIAIGGTAPLAVLDIAATGSASSIILPRDTTGNRPSGVNGMMRYNTSNNAFEGFANGGWGSLAAAATGPWTTSGSSVYYTGGNVGIGTSAPAAPLHVGYGTAGNTIVQAGQDGGLFAWNNEVGLLSNMVFRNGTASVLNASYPSWGIDLSSSATDTFTISRAPAGSTTGANYLTIINGGNVGIGTATPISRLANTSVNSVDAVWGQGIAPAGLTWLTNAGGWAQTLTQQSTASNADGLLVQTAGTASGNSILQAESGGVNRLIVRSDGFVGIGTASPTNKLQVVGDIGIIGPSTNGNLYISNNGSNQIWAAVTGVGTNGYFAIYDSTNAKSPFTIEGNSPSSSLYVKNSGNVGIGTSNPGQALEVNGTVKAAAFLSTSDARLKTQIESIRGLEAILKLRGVHFRWLKDGTPEVGLIAQEVEAVFPELVVTDPSTGLKAVKYQNLVAPLIEATKELDQRLRDLEAENKGLRADLEALRRDVQALKER